MHVHERPNFVEKGPKLVILFFLYLIYCKSGRGKHYTFHVVRTVLKNTHIYILHVKEGEL
jgi:hypothetical protein